MSTYEHFTGGHDSNTTQQTRSDLRWSGGRSKWGQLTGSEEQVKESHALSALVETIDSNRVPRKALAEEVGATEQSFSKMLAGTQAFGIDAFGRLPSDVQVCWMKRYGKVLGLEVRDVTAMEMAEDIVSKFSDLFKAIERAERLDAVKPRGATVKAELGMREPQRKVG